MSNNIGIEDQKSSASLKVKAISVTLMGTIGMGYFHALTRRHLSQPWHGYLFGLELGSAMILGGWVERMRKRITSNQAARNSPFRD